MATDPETGDTRPRTVTDTRDHRSGKELVTLTVDPDGDEGAAKPGKITSTASHLFWLPDYGTWDEAADLESGMWLQTASGTWVQITAVDTSHRTERVHNLTVEGVHTYYVVAGGTSVLVHNCGPDAENVATWVDEGGDLRATPPRPGMPPNAYTYQSGVAGARSNPATGRGMAPQLEMPGADGIPVTAKFDGVNGNEIIDRKLNPRFTEKAVDQARRQAATAVYNGLQAVWELPTADAVAAANRFMTYAGITTITVRMAP